MAPASLGAFVANQRVLGIDPGMTRCGLGCVDVDSRRRVRLVEVGVARTPPNQSPELRLKTIADAIDDWIARHAPHVIAIERVFAQENMRSVIAVAQVMGVAMLAGARHNLEVALHTPSEVKAAISGNGRADKAQVQTMVARVLGLDALPKPADAADALALAICHGWRGGGTGQDGITEMVSAGGQVRASARTPAQRRWAQAQANARRTGAVDPRRRRG